MNNKDIWERYNCQICEINSIYHTIAVKMHLADSEMIILYVLCELGYKCYQNEIYKLSGISRKTINTALIKMSKNGLILVEKTKSNSSIVILTEKGIELASKTAMKVIQIEEGITSTWTTQERSDYLRLTQKYIDGLKSGAEKI